MSIPSSVRSENGYAQPVRSRSDGCGASISIRTPKERGPVWVPVGVAVMGALMGFVTNGLLGMLETLVQAVGENPICSTLVVCLLIVTVVALVIMWFWYWELRE
jgi:hypothetical protein